MEEKDKHPILPEFKYYNGEDEDNCPFPKNDVRSKYWWGERMFSRCSNHYELIHEYEKSVKKWRIWLQKHKPNQAAHFLETNSTRQLCIAFYIVMLYGKWCPYDDLDWVLDY